MKRIFWLAVSLALMTPVIAQQELFTERIDYWQRRLNNEIPLGTSRGDFLQWVEKNRLKASRSQRSGDISVRLEAISAEPSSSPEVCTSYQIFATLKLDAKDRISVASVGARDDCIF